MKYQANTRRRALEYEKALIEFWKKNQTFEKSIEQRDIDNSYVFYDGPPFITGMPHHGTLLSSVTKDALPRFWTMRGKRVERRWGWDCHGLPAENFVEKQLGITDRREIGTKWPLATYIEKAKESMVANSEAWESTIDRIGRWVDFRGAYRTMDKNYMESVWWAFKTLYDKGLIFEGRKVLMYDTKFSTPVSKAEVMMDNDAYQEVTDPSVFVKFKVVSEGELQGAYLLAWTTTPWTLPASQAVSAGADVVYQLIDTPKGKLVLAKDLAEDALKRYGFASDDLKVLAETTGDKLENLHMNHPFLERDILMLNGEHVTPDAGTGLVHTAPAHGLEDYAVCNKYGIELYNPVNAEGKYISETPRVAGMSVWEANPVILQWLGETGNLLASSKIEHSYAHCWRHKTPLIYGATGQWFVGMDKAGADGKTLRDKAIKAVDDTEFFPSWGRARLEAMIEGRPDWVVSRQRYWGTPMTFFVHKETGELHPNSAELLEKVAQRIEEKGIEAWFSLDKSELLSAEDCENYDKLSDTMDVWFDSGSTHYSVLKQREELDWPADLYLEGSDQHRGWFQSSMLTGCASSMGRAPYKQLLTHGFVVDQNGRKMSKSIGNVVAPQEVYNEFGADILRLWAASTDYSGELAISKEILKRVTESYRRIRNTLSFLFANLSDFNPIEDAVQQADMVEIDRYAVVLARQLQERLAGDYYPRYAFHFAVKDIVSFCSEDLGAFYLDILKDRLYTTKADSHARRSAQTALYHITRSLVLLIAPILCFTGEEAWDIIGGGEEDSVLFHTWHEFPSINEKAEAEVVKKWTAIREAREAVTAAIEPLRTDKTVGSSLQVETEITAPEEIADYLNTLGEELRFALLVSKAEVKVGNELTVTAKASDGEKCERCWHYTHDVGAVAGHETICKRCADNVDGKGEERHYA